jgi:fatty acid desaturase
MHSHQTKLHQENKVMSIIEEKAIAKKYIGDFPLFVVIWGLGGPILWLALWPLVSLGYLPMWAGGIMSTIILHYSYYPTHEAEHGNIGQPNSRWRWLNELIGHASAFPFLLPYRLHRIMHIRHHAYTNDDNKDPDIYMRADNIWQAIRNSWLHRQPNQKGHLNFDRLNKSDVLENIPSKQQVMLEALLMMRFAWLVMAVLTWSGYALELLILWWIPRQIAWVVLPVLSSWAPHYPLREKGRYRNTHGWKSIFGIYLTAGLEYHFIHHLFPSIPVNKMRAAYRELKPLLEEKGMTLNNL